MRRLRPSGPSSRLAVMATVGAVAILLISSQPSRTIQPSDDPVPYPQREFRHLLPSPSPSPSPSPTPEPTARMPQQPTGATERGTASTYGPGYRGYLALPQGRGIKVRICGSGGCIVRVSNDAGPSLAMQRKGRIADLNIADFESVCGCSWRKGLTKVTVEYYK
jgi:hypothetical protein